MKHPNDRPELYRPLGDRPEASTISVTSLLTRVAHGRVRVPDFQRGLRWTNDDVVKLFDSLWRGYPAGSLLFWKRPAPAAEVRLGSARLAASAQTDAWWVVDGQQRITALAASLLDLEQGHDRRWRVYFDPELPGFRGGEVPVDRRHRAVPASTLGDIKRLGRWFREFGGDDDDDAIYDAQARILEYTFPIYVLTTDDEQALRAAFARLNSTGAKMRADEVFTALLGQGDTHGRSLDLATLERACDFDGFGSPDRGDVLKSVLAMSGLDPTKRLQDLASADLNRLVPQADAIDALGATVSFLQDEAQIPHIRLLPYPVVFSILARWFHTFPDTRDEEREGLVRWVWRGIATGLHLRAEVSRMRLQVQLIRKDDRRASLDDLLAQVAAPWAGAWNLKRFNAKSAHSRVEMLALWEAKPRDPLGPVSLAALASQDRMAKEIFASPSWKGLEAADAELAKSGANRVLLTDGHTGLQRALRDWRAGDMALDSHLIDAEAFLALQEHDVPTTLRRRGERLRREVTALLSRRCAWEAPTVRPRDHYFEADIEDDDADDDLDLDSRTDEGPWPGSN